jgi:hypothetical protein
MGSGRLLTYYAVNRRDLADGPQTLHEFSGAFYHIIARGNRFS